MIDTNHDIFDALTQPAIPGTGDPLDKLLDLWETSGIGMGEIRGCLDNLAARRRITPRSTERTKPPDTANPPPVAKRYTKPFRRATGEDLQAMRELRTKGMTYKQIALEMQFSVAAVYKRLSNEEHSKRVAT